MLNGTTESSRAHIRRVFAGLLVVLLISSSAIGALAAVQRISRAAEIDEDLEAQLQKASETDRLLVFVHAPDISIANRSIRAAGLTQIDAFERVGVAIALGTPGQIRRVGEESGVTFVEGDQPIEFFMQTSHIATRGEDALRGFSVTSTSTPTGETKRKGKARNGSTDVTQTATAFDSPGVDGSGVSVGIIDSGVDGTHPLFQDAEGNSKVLKNYKFVCASGVLIPLSGPCTGPEGDAIDPAFVDMTSFNDTDTPSTGGHGTHVAGIAAGVDSEDLPVHGAAPGAKIISLSVGQVISVYGGSAGMNWVLEHHAAPCGEDVSEEECPPIKVINNSWGSGGSFNPDDLRSKLQDALVDAGVTVVWAAGNAGGDGSEDEVNPPAKSPTPGVLSVANYDDGESGTRDGGLASTSSRGEEGKTGTYPDISAPGSNIYSACRAYLAICSSGEDDSDYGTISGTSMATPHIAGIVAQLIQAGREALGRDLAPGEIEDILEDTAYKFTFGAAYEPDVGRNRDHLTSFDKGHGLVDAMAAVAEARGFPLASGGTVCLEGGPEVVDVPGDASHSSTDVLLGTISSRDIEGKKGTDVSLTFTIQVEELTPEEYPPGSNGIFFDFDFSYGGEQLFAGARRRQLGGTPPTVNEESFFIGQQQGQQLVTLASGLQGKFDFDNHQVVIVVSQEDMDRAEEALEDADLPRLADGGELRSLVAQSRTLLATTGPSLVSQDDSGASSCLFEIQSSVPPEEGKEPKPKPSHEPKPHEADATLSVGNPEHTWEGEPTTDSAAFFACNNGLSESTCDEEFVQVIVPEGGTNLEVTITSNLEDVNDFDLFVYGPDGREIASSANSGSAEGLVVPVSSSGVYRIEVVAFATVNATYTGVARLI